LPSHARAVVVTDGRNIVVETTSPEGFDPPPAIQAATRARTRPHAAGGHELDIYGDENGTEVDLAALLAVVYGNVAIFSAQQGKVALASALAAREAALTPPGYMSVVRIQQMSLLVQLAQRKRDEGDRDGALALARQAYDIAPDANAKKMAEMI